MQTLRVDWLYQISKSAASNRCIPLRNVDRVRIEVKWMVRILPALASAHLAAQKAMLPRSLAPARRAPA